MIHVAAASGQPRTLIYLLNLGVDYGACDRSGLTPLHIVGENPSAAVAKTHHLNPKLEKRSRVRINAHQRSSVTIEIAIGLVNAGADYLAESMSGATPVEAWLHRGEEKLVLAAITAKRDGYQVSVDDFSVNAAYPGGSSSCATYFYAHIL